MLCPKCGTHTDGQEEICSHCGVPLHLDDMDVIYETEGWGTKQRSDLTEALLSKGIPHEWDGNELRVATQYESTIDAILATPIPGESPDGPQSVDDGQWWAQIPSGRLYPVSRTGDLTNSSTLSVNDKGIAWGYFGPRRVLVPWTQLREIQIGQLDHPKGSQRSAFGSGLVGLAFVAATSVHNSRASRTERYQVIRVYNRSGEYFDFATTNSRDAVVKLLGPTILALMAYVGKEALEPEAEITRTTSMFSVADELEKLVKLRDSGVLSEEEFATQKARLLAQ